MTASIVAWVSLAVAGLALAWEALIKPRRAKRSLQAALAAEIADNVNYFVSILEEEARDPTRIPPNFRLSTRVYEAVAPELGTLNRPLLAKVVALYRQFDELNWAPEYAASLETAMATCDSQPMVNHYQSEADLHASTFYRLARVVLRHAQQTVDVLRPDASGHPLPHPYRIDGAD